jgi:uncharacterized membrane protein YhaH (DUF805 family)
MSYLFSFGGRINRAKMWLFILVTLAWEIVIGLVAVFGMHWSRFGRDLRMVSDGLPPMPHTVVQHWPGTGDPVTLVAFCFIALLIVLYAVAMLAVYTKRLHDRNKGMIWLVPFVIIPWALEVLRLAGAPWLFDMGRYMGPVGMDWGLAQGVAGLLWLWGFVELFFFRGTIGANRFGSDPLA